MQKISFILLLQTSIWTVSHGCIPLITGTTRVRLKTYLIDNIFSHIFLTPHWNSKKDNKSDVSEHFPIFVSQNSPSKICKENHYYLQNITIHKRVFHDPKQTKFKADLHLIATQYIISQKKIQNAKYTLT